MRTMALSILARRLLKDEVLMVASREPFSPSPIRSY
jgi:hypothetical protein